jgi:hypothetical protein
MSDAAMALVRAFIPASTFVLIHSIQHIEYECHVCKTMTGTFKKDSQMQMIQLARCVVQGKATPRASEEA